MTRPACFNSQAILWRTHRQRGGNATADDIALVLHTSGTTSRPKIVPLTQANICATAAHVQETLALTPEDCCLNVMPLFHIHGLMAAVLSSLGAGASIFCSPGFHALKFFVWMKEANPSWYTAVPTMHQAILARAARNREVIETGRLRLIRSSSASLPPQVMRELEETFDAPVIESYGMTEAAHQMTSNPLPPRQRKAGTVGVAAGPEVSIIDEDGNLLAPGSTGGSRHPRTQRHQRLSKQSRCQCDRVYGRLAPNGRPRDHRRRWLPDNHRATERDHQSGRREDFASRG